MSFSNLLTVGTRKMGTENNPKAVVDYRLLVKGVKGLCEAEAAPLIVQANTNTVTIMVGERAADFIKALNG